MKDHLGAKLDAYLDGSISGPEKADVEAHLRTCASCESELKALKILSERIEEAKPTEVPNSPFKSYWNRLLMRHKEVKTMSALQRIRRVVESNIHSAIDSMEDPSKMIKQLLREMEASIHEAREEVVGAIVIEKGLAHRFQEATANVKKWDGRAMLALKNQREELAREALKEQISLEGLAEDLQIEHEKQKTRVGHLKEALKTLERQFEDLRRRKAIWLTQVQNSLGRSSSRRAYETAYNELARMLETVRERTIVETSAQDVYETETVEETFEAMDKHQDLEQRLSVLKQRIQP